MAITIGALVLQARNMLNDIVQEDGQYRYSDAELYDAFNDALLQARAKRPDIFIPMGLRNAVPQYDSTVDSAVAFPLDLAFTPAFMFYMVGRIELKEDTFTDDNRAVTLMNKFVSQLLTVQS